MTTAAQFIGVERFKMLFDYDLASGKVYWKNVSKYHREKNGKEAGGSVKHHSKTDKYYWIVRIDGRSIRRATIIYALATETIPDLIDHKNGNSLDDRLVNLRPATPLQNSQNRKIGKPGKLLPMGVRINAHSGRYSARITYEGCQTTIGTFETASDARAAYLNKRRELYGEFA